MPGEAQEYADFVIEVLESELRALNEVVQRLDRTRLAETVRKILECRGRVIVTGVGKAGIIGQKISATFASTGTPAYWIHPVEAVHGDLGRILGEDLVIMLSNSGETEVVRLLPYIKRAGAGTIGVTGAPDSTLARHCDLIIDIGRITEACPLGLAPSASTTVMLALGDALALAAARERKFDRESYALYHPGGELGRKLMRVEEVMRAGEQCPAISEDATVREAIGRITGTTGRAGAICVVDGDGKLAGIFTDGDLRRRLLEGADFLDRPISEVMTRGPKHVKIGGLAGEAGHVMEKHRIDDLPVVDENGVLAGIIDIQDMLESRLIE